MAKLSVCYEEQFETGGLAPNWMVVHYGRSKMNWDANQFYIPLEAPFKQKKREDFGDDEMSFSVTIEDLMIDITRPNGFIVNMKSILRRIHALKAAGNDFNHFEIDQFIIQMSDIEEIMQMDIRPFYDWA
jgi:hypothetical protein